MKKVIEGSLYNTETAKELGSYRYSNNTDFAYFKETLYLTKAGKYFLHGVGGAMSKYATSCGNNNYSGDSRIEPMDYQSAQEWAERKLDGDEYEAIFGEIDEAGTGRVPRTFTLSLESINKLEKMKQASGINYGVILDTLISDAK